MTKNTFDSLLYSTTKPSYIKALTISDADEKYLLNAKQEIKQAIVEGFRHEKLTNKSLVDVGTPRFAQQGSYVYKTLNKPLNPPEQQLDIDYGVYLPMSSLGENTNLKESVAKLFFETIETILKKYLKNNHKGWALLESQPKNTCCRILLRNDMHMDLPLYACPDDKMRLVTEDRAINLTETQKQDINYQLDDFDNIDSNLIHLALRDGKWMQSDPLILRNWVKKQCNSYGNNHIRYICRFLKGWRDEKDWGDIKEPSSILLLALTIDLYSDQPEGISLKLFHVIDRISDRLNQPVEIWVNDNDKENLLNSKRLDTNTIKAYQKAFQELRAEYIMALAADSKETANEYLINLFGTRFPLRPFDIENSIASEIRNIPSENRNQTYSPKPPVTSG